MTRELKIELFEPGADPEMVDDLAADLRLELLELDVESVSPVVQGPPADGSKGIEVATLGALLVCIKDSVWLVEEVVGTVRSWLSRGSSSRRSLKITVEGRSLELSGATDEQQQQLVAEFVRSLGAPTRPDPA
ncbi:hypothetical protein [Nocardioides panacihumi]|uniref:hypothetical protein n=1 Tax=Nocardioides panacihumi TaxID=400774 RepID=UPI0031D88714